MFKKAISLFSAFCLVCVLVCCVPTFAYAEEETSSMAEEETVICTIPEGVQYELGKVLVVLKKSATVINKIHAPESFGDVGVVSVEELSYITNKKARRENASLFNAQ